MCGIFGLYGHPQAAHLTYLGLHALQHRGQESAGMTACDGERMRTHRAMGLVVDVFGEGTLERLPGRSAIGHVRYSTSGESLATNAQPIAVRYANRDLAVAHNGNLTNEAALRRMLEERGSIFSSTSDSEVFVHLYAAATAQAPEQRLISALSQVEGAYSILALTSDALYAARDPHGFRPLSLGKIEHEGKTCWVVASETSAFGLIGARYERQVEPGELVVIDSSGLRSLRLPRAATPRFCVFEHIYFARPDSMLGDRSVYAGRERLGRRLADEAPAQADVVVPVPDSGTAAALGYAEVSGIRFAMGLIRSHYVGRTFIEPEQSVRNFGVRLKLAPVRSLIDGKRIVVIDDSLVRGTTSRKIVAMLREAGASEVHLRIAAPATRFPCYYGIDMPTRDQLIASERPVVEIAAHVGCDSLGYLSMEGMVAALAGDGEGGPYCDACFSGQYPVAPEGVAEVADAQEPR